MYLAPLNSMAANINGMTVHSCGEIGFKDARGRHIAVKSNKEDNVSTVAGQLGFAKWIMIDEVEACGAELLSMLEEDICKKVPYSSRDRFMPDGLRAAFGGVSVLQFGDAWQLPPTGTTMNID